MTKSEVFTISQDHFDAALQEYLLKYGKKDVFEYSRFIVVDQVGGHVTISAREESAKDTVEVQGELSFGS